GTKVCKYKPIRLDRLDAAVWADVCTLVQNPKALEKEFERRLSSDHQLDIDVDQIQKQTLSLQRGISRLIDAYEAGVLEKGEFEPRVARARERLKRLQQEAAAAKQMATSRKEWRVLPWQQHEFVRPGRQRLGPA